MSGLNPSVGSVADAFDNALAETTIGLYKIEAVQADSPFRRGPLHRLADVEILTGDWGGWSNTHRLMHCLEAASRRLDTRPPTTLRTQPNQRMHTHTSNHVCIKLEAVQFVCSSNRLHFRDMRTLLDAAEIKALAFE